MKHRFTKIGRNNPCPCGSGKKYKKCCLGKKGEAPGKMKTEYAQKYGIRLKETSDVEKIRTAGRLVIDTLDLVEEIIRPGLTTEEINSVVHDYTIMHNRSFIETRSELYRSMCRPCLSPLALF